MRRGAGGGRGRGEGIGGEGGEGKGMNKVVLVGRLTREPEVRYSQGERQTAVGRYTLAVDRRLKREGGQEVDFIPCVTFGKMAEFAEKYFRKGMRVSVSGRIQTGSYTNKDGIKVYTTDVFVEEQEFAESRGERQGAGGNAPEGADAEPPWMDVPEGLDDDLPFH